MLETRANIARSLTGLVMLSCAISIAAELGSKSADSYENDLSETDLKAAYGVFGVKPGDPAVFHIGGSVTVRDEATGQIAAYIALSPRALDERTCVVDVRVRIGLKTGSAIEWDSDNIDSLRFAWRPESVGICEEKYARSGPNMLEVSSSVPETSIPLVLASSDTIFNGVFHFPEGVRFQNWENPRMIILKREGESGGSPRYCARYQLADEMDGPDVCFLLEGSDIEVISVQYWGSGSKYPD